MSKVNKTVFEVNDGESIDACLDRIKAEGYFPVRRVEKPIFEERMVNGHVKYEPIRQKIIFEAKLME